MTTASFVSTPTENAVKVVNQRGAPAVTDRDPSFSTNWRSSCRAENALALVENHGVSETPVAVTGFSTFVVSAHIGAFTPICGEFIPHSNLSTKLDEFLAMLEWEQPLHVSDSVLEAARRALSAKRNDPLSEEEIRTWANRLAESTSGLDD